MSNKYQRELHGPGWGEVILGALLSFILGVVLAMAFLIFTPVEKVKAMPKEPKPKVVYYLEGNALSGRAGQAQSKAKAFLQGKSVVLNEDELNALATGFSKKRGTGKPAANPENAIENGTPNFRIHDGVLQVGVPLEISTYGLTREVILQARGGFTKSGDTFVFDPTEVYVGSCPIERLPMLQGMIFDRLIAVAELPEGVPAAWQKLSDVAVDGSTLRLTAATP